MTTICLSPHRSISDDYDLVGHIAFRVDTLSRELRQRNLESLLNRLKHLLISLAADERDGKTLCAETAGTTDAVQVRVGIAGQVVVDGQVDALDVNTAAEDVGGYTDTLVEVLELFIALDAGRSLVLNNTCSFRVYIPLLLADARMHSNTREIALAKQFVELGGTESALDEDDDLVELKLVQQFIEFAVLFCLAELDVVLLQTVQGELGLAVDVDLQRILHEFLGDRSDFLRQSRAEHHDLLLGGSGTEDLLHIAAHIWSVVSDSQYRYRVLLTHQSDQASCHTHRVRNAECFQDGASCRVPGHSDDQEWRR